MFLRNKNLKANLGFSLVEVLVAAFLLALGISATFGLFTFVISTIGKTERLAKANAAIDSDVAIVKQKSEEYTACTEPRGNFDRSSCDQNLGNAYYYFPKVSSSGSVFYDACRTSIQSNHITNNFMLGLNSISKVNLQDAGVDRLTVVRDNPSNPLDHSVLITYRGIKIDVERVLKISPVLSSWCP